jgi:hypothetical protein
MKWLSSIIVFAVASSGSGVGAQDAPSQARADLAPTGKLRVAPSRYRTSPSAIRIRDNSGE